MLNTWRGTLLPFLGQNPNSIKPELVVLSAEEGSASERGMVEPGDRVTSIKSKDVRGKSYEEVMTALKEAKPPFYSSIPSTC